MFSFNPDKIREDFPFYENNPDMIYMDSSCMTLRPKQVVEKLEDYYYKYPACAGRSAHKLAKKTTEEYENSRDLLKKFIGAKSSHEVIFTRNTTEGLNIVANSYSLQKGDAVLTTDKEHNSNLIPWQVLAKKKGINHKVVMSNDDLSFSMENFEELLTKDVKMVSMVHSSNLDGCTIPAKEIIKAAHDNDALVMLDAAQSMPHKDIDVRKLDVDFLSFSGHKMLGPSGTGVLYAKEHLLEQMEPYNVGGDTVADSTYESHEFLPPPEKFEAGLQNYAGAMGLAEAARYLLKVGKESIAKHEAKLNTLMTEGIKDIEGLHIIGPEDAKLRGGVVDFHVDGVDPHEIALNLSETSDIMVRSGAHCVHSWFNAHDLKGAARASLYLYNSEEEANTFVEELKKIIDMVR